jgi:hypothetical protein
MRSWRSRRLSGKLAGGGGHTGKAGTWTPVMETGWGPWFHQDGH